MCVCVGVCTNLYTHIPVCMCVCVNSDSLKEGHLDKQDTIIRPHLGLPLY